MENLILLGSVIGGLGLFLLAIGMMTEGLKLAAGNSLRGLLAKYSDTPIKGVISGAIMTAIVQSSSAVTVASLGFVNAGLLRMRHALGIVYGANVGTTMTGWLVAAVGFKINIAAFALPMIGIGMILKLLNPKGRLASIGIALAGFGLFFVGIDTLKAAFEGIVITLDLSQITAEGATGFVTFLLIGVTMTVLTQSSSASIALTITAATSGIVGLYAAGAMVIGANIGTTSTALLASVGATSSAKRVAAAQVLFNVATALVAVVTLPILFGTVSLLTQWLNVPAAPGITLALFHTLFNVLGVFLVFPFNDTIVNFLEQRFTSIEEKESHPQYLDKNIAQTPVLAVNATILELLVIADKFLALYPSLFSTETNKQDTRQSELEIITKRCSHVSQFIVNVEGAVLNEDTTIALSALMRVEHYFVSCTHSAKSIIESDSVGAMQDNSELKKRVFEFIEATSVFLRMVRWRQFDSEASLNVQMELLSKEYHDLKSNLIISATRSQISVSQMTKLADAIACCFQISQWWFKAFERLQYVEDEINQPHFSISDK